MTALHDPLCSAQYFGSLLVSCLCVYPRFGSPRYSNNMPIPCPSAICIHVEPAAPTVCSFELRVVHCLTQRGSRILFNTFIKGHVRKNESKRYKERVKERASTSKTSA